MKSIENRSFDRIREFGETRLLLQRELIPAGNLPARAVGRIERGEEVMRVYSFVKVTGALKVDLKSLLL